MNHLDIACCHGTRPAVVRATIPDAAAPLLAE